MQRNDQPGYVPESERPTEDTPPFSWFVGFGKKAEGIKIVSVTEQFTEMGEGEVGRHWNQYKHYTGNPVTESDTAERRERAGQAIAEARAFITEATGFAPEIVRDVEASLTETYRGKMTAPFEVELY